MRYNWNPDASIRQLERTFKETGNLTDFLNYRRALARSGHKDILQLKKGHFVTSPSANDFDYVKSVGPKKAILVPGWMFTIMQSHPPDQLVTQKQVGELLIESNKKGRSVDSSMPLLRKWMILIPLPLAKYVYDLRIAFIRKNEAGIKDSLAQYAVTQRPKFQEQFYRLVTSELEGLGYWQPEPLEDLFCMSGCGRNLGLRTPAREHNKQCFYCWQKQYSFNQKWLDDQLQYHGSYAPQLRRNPDDRIHQLEQEALLGDEEAFKELIRNYLRIGYVAADIRLEEFALEIARSSEIARCDTNPIVSIEVVQDVVQRLSSDLLVYGLFTRVQKWQKGEVIVGKCCELREFGVFEDKKDAVMQARVLSKQYNLDSIEQQSYIKWHKDRLENEIEATIEYIVTNVRTPTAEIFDKLRRYLIEGRTDL